MAITEAKVTLTPEQENAGGGSGFHLVTNSASDTLAVIDTSHLAGHKLVIVAYGTVGQTGLRFSANGVSLLTTPRPANGQFFFDAVVFVNAASNEIHAIDNSPLADVNTRQATTLFDPLPKTIVFKLEGAIAVHSFQLWKLGLK